VHLNHVVDAVHPARDAGLIGDHSDGDAGTIERADCFRCPVDEVDPVDRADVAVIDDDRAVAVQEDAGAQADTVQPS